jgi:hypothetical protein
MKKIVLSLVLIAGIASFASSQMRIGLNAGFSLGTFKNYDLDNEGDFTTTTGFLIGVVGDMHVAKKFHLRPGLQFVQKGGVETTEVGGVQTKATTTLNYLELPIDFVYKTKAMKGMLFLGAGPSLAYAFSGKLKTATPTNTQEIDIDFGDDENTFKPFDLGVNLLVGFELSYGIYFQANSNFGLTNLSNAGEGATAKTTYIGIRLGYRFRG